MFADAVACLTAEHDPRLVLTAAASALIGSLVSARLFTRVGAGGSARGSWRLFQAGLTGGVTIWAVHFVAMMGYDPGLPHSFDVGLTLLSLVAAIAAVSAGLVLVRFSGGGWLIEGGGALTGLGIFVMHFAGMASLEIGGTLMWDRGGVLSAAAAGPLLAAFAANRLARPGPRGRRIVGALAFAGAICVTHFAAMDALTILPNGETPALSGFTPGPMLAVLLIAVLGLFLLGGLASVLLDETLRRETAERLRRQALRDDLTGLPNRAQLRARLSELLDKGASVAVATLDVDRFAQINEVHGHVGGDMLLRTLAARLAARLGPGETLHRSGGDEFVAVKLDPAGPEDALAFAARLRDSMLAPVEWAQFSLAVGASVGVALAPLHAREADDLLGRASLAMHRAKTSRLGAPQLYDPRMDEAKRARSALAMEMRQALARREFELFLQPQNLLETRKISGYEALIRWRHPIRGLVPPDAFIPLAEATGLIGPIGDWVLHEACAAAAAWPAPHRIAVNVAPQQLSLPGFAESVLDALHRSGLSPDRLELELTEASLIDDHDRALQVVRQLKRAGVRIAMDDYGAGYASLATLQTFPFDKIKIDRAFIGPVATNRQAAAIVRSTLILGEALGIPVLAEGVETEDQARFLLAHGCREAQGYLFGRPRPRAEVEAEMRKAQAA